MVETTDGAGNIVPFGAMKIVSTLAWGLGYFGMPHILLRFMAIENPKKIKLSRRVASIWVFIANECGGCYRYGWSCYEQDGIVNGTCRQ